MYYESFYFLEIDEIDHFGTIMSKYLSGFFYFVKVDRFRNTSDTQLFTFQNMSFAKVPKRRHLC